MFLSDIRLAEKAYAAWDEFFDVERVDRSQRPTRITQAASLKSPEINWHWKAEEQIELGETCKSSIVGGACSSGEVDPGTRSTGPDFQEELETPPGLRG